MLALLWLVTSFTACYSLARECRESAKASHSSCWSHRLRKKYSRNQLALTLGGEIINCDSVQVYQGIQIATAKVPLAERRGVPHHLIDFVPPEVNYTAGDWAREAAAKIEEIEARGAVPILVGGTGLYLRALRRPFFCQSADRRKPAPASDDDARAARARISTSPLETPGSGIGT